MKPIIAALLLVVVVSCAPNHKYKAEILDVGLFTGGSVESTSGAPETARGIISSHSASELKENTSRVPAEIGTIFGFTYTLVGAPAGERVPLRYVWKTPGVMAPGKSTLFQEEFPWANTIGEKGGHLLRLDEEWELIPGIWTLQVFHGKQLLAERSFEIYRPAKQDIEP